MSRGSRERMRGFRSFTLVDEAVKALISAVDQVLDAETVPISEAVGRYAAEDLVSPKDWPPYDRSAVDGVAVRAEDVSGASPDSPIPLRIVGEVAPSIPLSKLPRVSPGEAAVIYTGAPIPPGADAVVPIEEVIIEGGVANVMGKVPPKGNVSLRGEDLRAGDVIVSTGQRIRPWHVVAVAQVDITEVRVWRRYRVAVVNTGNELREVGEVGEGIPNTAAYLISSWTREAGAEVVSRVTVPDDEAAIREAVAAGLRVADAVVVTGGTSVGKADVVPEAISSIPGARLVFHGVAERPGRTAGAFVVGGKPVLMVSGLPVACLVALNNFLRPLILRAYGTVEGPRPVVRAKLARRVANVVGFRSYYRVVVWREGGEYFVEPLMISGSGVVSSLIKGNGILVVPEHVEGHDEGEYVEVELIGPVLKGRPSWLR